MTNLQTLKNHWGIIIHEYQWTHRFSNNTIFNYWNNSNPHHLDEHNRLHLTPAPENCTNYLAGALEEAIHTATGIHVRIEHE